MFANGRWSIAWLTWQFDVLELPAHLGAPLHAHLNSRYPTALAPATRRWQFFVEPGSVTPDGVKAAGGQVIAGSSGWMIALGTYTEATGRVRWLTAAPYLTSWQPHRPKTLSARCSTDILDGILM
ncbi:hypothetical protein E0H73_40115 [Kribbella pittospori]|uniref:Uncharacterized protein n=1 Tax=Kribbella pittospori TaxID=722689 RepID=A0A4R0K0N9_9ACTN|nr:hypothetical protein [Kribbella pittospori]TCC52144.1 hypothetical protein E0H73_40115 [Kribbella pittospori]